MAGVRIETEIRMKKTIHVAVTILIMLIISGLLVRLVDATVQIDHDIGMLALLLVLVNAALAALSYLLFRHGNGTGS